MTLLHRDFALSLIAFTAPALAANSSVPTVMHVDVGSEINIRFELSGKDAVGFTHKQRTASEVEAVGAVMAKLSSTQGWLQFNDAAHCHVISSGIGANVYRAPDEESPKGKLPITKPAFDVSYTFACDAITALRSLDVGFIQQFPRVREVIVDLRTPAFHRAEIVTTPTATISLTPN